MKAITTSSEISTLIIETGLKNFKRILRIKLSMHLPFDTGKIAPDPSFDSALQLLIKYCRPKHVWSALSCFHALLCV